MTFEMLMEEKFEAGMEKGIKKGIEKELITRAWKRRKNCLT